MLPRVVGGLLALALAACAAAPVVPPEAASGAPDAAVPAARPPAATALHEDPSAEAPARNALLWEIRGGGAGTLYLLGSVHFGDEDVMRFDPVVLDAFARADTLVVEIDLSRVSPQELAQRMLERAKLPPGETLEDRLPPELYAKLAEVLLRYGSHIDYVRPFEPWFAGLTLGTLAIQSEGYASELGVDRYFVDEMAAVPDGGKEIVALETAESQLELFDGLSEEVQLVLLRTALEDAEGETDTAALFDAWKRGDAEALEQVLFADLIAHPEAEPFYEAFFFDRNRAMSARLEDLLQRDRVYFAVVGAGHVVGARGIVSILRGRGYAARRVRAAP